MARHRPDGERHAPRPTRLVHRLTALPWVSLVLAGLVLTVTVALLRQDVFSASSTVMAGTSRAAQEAAVTLSGPDMVRQVEDEVEIDEDWPGSLRLDLARPHPEVVVVRASATDPRLAALAADTAAALLVRDRDDLRPGQAAVVPTSPVEEGRWWTWMLGGLSALALAVLAERHQRLRVEREMQASRRTQAPRPAADGTDLGGDDGSTVAHTAPLTRASMRARQAARHALQVPPVPRHFRADIEGMRAIAVVGVMLWHAGVALLPGGFVGVDVFFVVSGFLMTALLLEEARARGRIDVGRFYARRARRLLPAALTALLGTAVLSLVFIPRTRWADIGGDVLASAAYLVNWRLADRSVDYLDLDRAPSPVQHYWSLAVEEQFYVLWPLLLLLLLVAARGRARFFRGWSWGLTLFLLGSSLALSWWWTGHSATQAYFVTPTRIHELMLGALVALGARGWPQLPRLFAALVGWIGLAMILMALFVIDPSTPFPGTATLLPTTGTALVIIAGFAAGGLGPERLLRARSLQWTGRISYSLYLWHWPFVAVAASLAKVGHGGPDHLPVNWGLLAVGLSIVPAWLSFRYVEEPVRVRGRVLARRLPRGLVTQRSLRLGLNCTLAGVLTGLLLVLVAPTTGTGGIVAWRTPQIVDELRAPVGAGTLDDPGGGTSAKEGAVLAGADQGAQLGQVVPGLATEEAVPDRGSSVGPPAPRAAEDEIPEQLGELAVPVEQVPDDLPVMEPEGCFVGLRESHVEVCEAGDPDGEVTVTLTGDSHAGMWITALDEIGRERGWRVLVLTKSSCPPAPGLAVPRSGQPDGDERCRAYQEELGPRLLELDPDVVLVSSASYQADPDTLAAAMADRVDQLREAGIVTGMIRDVPRPPFDVPECLLSHPDDAPSCGFGRQAGLAAAGTGQAELVALRPAMPVVDLTEAVCPGEICSPVVGDVVVWRDSNHLSATYVRSLRDRVEAQITPIVALAQVPDQVRSPLLQGERLGRP